jgi:hypothetical protein
MRGAYPCLVKGIIHGQRVLYNKTRESVDAYADMLFDLQQKILTSRVWLPNDKLLFNNSILSWLYF